MIKINDKLLFILLVGFIGVQTTIYLQFIHTSIIQRFHLTA